MANGFPDVYRKVLLKNKAISNKNQTTLNIKETLKNQILWQRK